MPDTKPISDRKFDEAFATHIGVDWPMQIFAYKKRKRFPITDEDMALWHKHTMRDLDHEDFQRRKLANACFIAACRMNQRDEHQLMALEAEQRIVQLRMDRAEQGLPNDSMAVVSIPEATKAPIPLRCDWMKSLGLDIEPNRG